MTNFRACFFLFFFWEQVLYFIRCPAMLMSNFWKSGRVSFLIFYDFSKPGIVHPVYAISVVLIS